MTHSYLITAGDDVQVGYMRQGDNVVSGFKLLTPQGYVLCLAPLAVASLLRSDSLNRRISCGMYITARKQSFPSL